MWFIELSSYELVGGGLRLVGKYLLAALCDTVITLIKDASVYLLSLSRAPYQSLDLSRLREILRIVICVNFSGYALSQFGGTISATAVGLCYYLLLNVVVSLWIRHIPR